MEVAKISAKGQISIPSAVRAAAHLAAGDRIGFEIREHEIVLVPLPARTLSELRGVWHTERRLPDLAVLRAQRADQLAQDDQDSGTHD